MLGAGIMARVKTKHYLARIKRHRRMPTEVQEYVCQCPRCLAFETLWFKADVLVPTIKFSQGEGDRIDQKAEYQAVLRRDLP